MKKNLAIALSALLLSSGAPAAEPKLNMVVDAQWLASHLADPDLVLLHVGPKDDYAAGHIPGARLVALKDIAIDSEELTLQVPAPAELKKRLGALGIGDASRVVVYFAKGWISPATRVIFTLQAAGLGQQATLLDGGIDEWRRQGKTTTAQASAASALAGPEVRMQPVVVDAAFVRSHARSPGYALVDARAPVYYDGVEKSGDMRKLRKGHIPGAVNIPFDQVAGLDNKLKTPAQLEALFRDSGITAGTRLIVYCHIGQQATAIIFAARSLGIEAVLYDGSFEDWTFTDGPVEKTAGR
jgi:thiosulfate/3-mercaptopyruvate sulfurtransferase